jgi:hypothetical protein
LQTLFKGKKSLYYYKNSAGRENFYIETDRGFELLVYKQYLIRNENRDLVAENKTYLGQLLIYLDNCSSIQPLIHDVSYNKKSLNRLFEFYYSCSGSEIVFQKEIQKIVMEMGVLAGSTATSLKFGGSEFTYLINTVYPSSINITSGFYFDFILPGNQRKWSINYELLYTSYKFNGTY